MNRFFLLQLFGKRPGEMPDAYRDASPAVLVRRGAPPTLLIHGGRDPLVPPSQAEQLDGRLEALGVPHALVLLPWAGHGCDFDLRTPSGQLTAYAIERFLASVTR